MKADVSSIGPLSFQQRANAWNISFRISLWRPIHIINPVDKTKLSCYSQFSHDVTKIQTTKLLILLIFYFNEVLEQLNTNIYTNFCSKWVLGFAIDYDWISKLLRDAAFTWQPSWLKSDLFREIWLSERFLYWEKYYFNVFEFLVR